MSWLKKTFNKAKKSVKKLGKAVGKAVKSVANTVVNTVKAVINDPLPTLLAIAGQAVGIPAPVTMALITGAKGGDLGDMAKAAALSYVGAKVAPAIAPTISKAVSGQIANEAIAKAVTNSVTSGLVAGTAAAIQGKDFGDAFAGAATGTAIAAGVSNIISEPVLAKAKELGFSDATGKLISSTLTGATTSGTLAAIQGGDFADAFTNGVVNAGVDYATMNATDALKTAYNNFTAPDTAPSFTGMAGSTSPTFAGMQGTPSSVIGQNDDAYNQILAEFEKPKSEGVGTQIGDPTAELSGSVTLNKPREGDVYVDVPQVDWAPAPQPTGNLQKLPEVSVTGTSLLDDMKRAAFSGNADILKELTEFGELPPPKTTTVSSDTTSSPLYPSIDFSNIPELKNIADATNAKSLEINKQHDALVAEIQAYEDSANKTPEKAAEIEQKVIDYNQEYEVKSKEIANLKQTYEDIKNTLTASQPTTEFGELPITPPTEITTSEKPAEPLYPAIDFTNVPTPEVSTTTTSGEDPIDLQKLADDAYAKYVNASIIAQITKTPEAIQYAEEAALEAELAKNIANESSLPVVNAPYSPYEEPGTLFPSVDFTNVPAPSIVGPSVEDTSAVSPSGDSENIFTQQPVVSGLGSSSNLYPSVDFSNYQPPVSGPSDIGSLPLINVPYPPAVDFTNYPSPAEVGPNVETSPPFPGVDFSNYQPPVYPGGIGSSLDGSYSPKEEEFLPPVEVIGDLPFPGVDFTNYPPPEPVGPDVEQVPPATGGLPPSSGTISGGGTSGNLPTSGGGTAAPNLNYGLITETSTYRPVEYVENPSFTLFPVPQRKQQFDPFSQYFKVGGLAAIKRR